MNSLGCAFLSLSRLCGTNLINLFNLINLILIGGEFFNFFGKGRAMVCDACAVFSDIATLYMLHIVIYRFRSSCVPLRFQLVL